MSWRDQAAYVGKPTDWWFPDNEDPHPYAYARPICMACPVRVACLDEALNEPGDHWGMRGGKTPRQRRELRSRRHRRVS